MSSQTAQPYPPTLEVKRQMLTAARDQFRAKGFEAELNIEALKAQEPMEDESLDAAIKSMENTATNNYKSARRMDAMLAKLPKPKEPAK